MNRTLVGSSFVLLSTAGYALLPIFIKLAYRLGLGPLDILAWRFMAAGLLVWLLWPVFRDQAMLGQLNRRQVATLLGLGGLFAVIALMAVLTLRRIPATTYTMLLYTYPAMVAALSFVLGERLPSAAWASIGLALAGCVLTAGGRLIVGTPLDLVFPMLNASLYAVYLVIAGRHTRQISGVASGIISVSGTASVLLPLAIASDLTPPPSLEGWLTMAAMGALSTVLPILTLFVGIAYLGASNASILSTLEPLITILLAAVLLKERVAPLQYLGGCLIVASVLLLQFAMRKTTPSVRLQDAAARS